MAVQISARIHGAGPSCLQSAFGCRTEAATVLPLVNNRHSSRCFKNTPLCIQSSTKVSSSSNRCSPSDQTRGSFSRGKRLQVHESVGSGDGANKRGLVQTYASAAADVPQTSDSLIISFGEVLIDFVPTVSGVSLAEAPAFKKAAGGAPANVAVGIARLGGKAAFVGKTGEDEFGHMLADLLKDNGVNTEGIIFDQGARTALAFVTLRADGEQEFMFYRNPSADMLLTPDELDTDLLKTVHTRIP